MLPSMVGFVMPAHTLRMRLGKVQRQPLGAFAGKEGHACCFRHPTLIPELCLSMSERCSVCVHEHLALCSIQT